MSRITPSPGIFESFNARSLEPQQVAKTFVPSQSYRALAKRAHTVLVGPRGSGKTTLLKMLQQPALEAWRHPQADQYREAVDFTGIFVATDVTWGEQLASLGQGRLDESSQRLLCEAAFTTHVLRAVVVSMYHRARGAAITQGLVAHRRVSLTTEQEIELVKAVSDAWQVGPDVFTLVSLKQAMTRRMAEIDQIGKEEAFRGSEGRKDRIARHSFLHLHFLSAANVCLERFDDATGAREGKWAFLFDELELAPRWIREQLFAALRSSEGRFLFKLSISPYNVDAIELERAFSATPGNDYDSIALWYAHKEDGSQFCRELWNAMVAERRLGAMLPEEVLGKSEFETAPEEWVGTGTAYKPGSRLQQRIVRMDRRDRSFREYLREKEIDPAELHFLGADARAADIRKVAPLLAVREAFRSMDEKNETESGTRSRKNPTLYSGASSLFAIVEGNPRWFIGIVGRLLDAVSREHRAVSASRQAAEIRAAGDRFAAMLRTIPCRISGKGESDRTVLNVLDGVGEYLFRAVVLDEFSADPPGSFIVDSRISEELLSSIGRALNAGAIVYVPDESGEVLLKSLRGKRFRLSYLLAPRYRIPLRLGRAVSLRLILEGRSEKKGKEKGLFEEWEE